MRRRIEPVPGITARPARFAGSETRFAVSTTRTADIRRKEACGIETIHYSNQAPKARSLVLGVFLAGICLSWLAIAPLAHAGNQPAKPKTPKRGWNAFDLDGRLYRLNQPGGANGFAVVFLSTGCPISNGYLPRLNTLARRYKKKGFPLFGVISDPSVTRTEAIEHRKTYRVRFPVLFDASGELRTALRPSHVPQAFVIDRQGRVVYTGLIDDEYAAIGQKRTKFDTHYLADAMRCARRGRKPAVAKTEPIGCLMEDDEPSANPAAPTYCRDIAPIIQAHCTTCHRPGEAAPFSLKTYKDAFKRAKQLVAVTQAGIMPPWKPVANFGHFRGERRLTPREIQLIVAWTQGGKPQGDPADLPPMPEFTRGWQLGKPDLILKMAQPFSLAANGPDILRHFVIPTGLQDDRLVAAMEFRPGNPRIAHHATVFFDNTGEARKLDARHPGYGYDRFGGPGFAASGSLGNWLPGTTPRRLPKGVGRLMPKGSDLVLQMHYQRTGKPESDQSMVGIFFAPRRFKQLVSEFQVLRAKLEIPPGAKRYHHRAQYKLPVSVTIFDAAPHMHLLGREMKVTATLPNGQIKPLIWIKNWDFNWQGQYVYLEPMHLPRGTCITVDAWLDNSKDNPLNPNSPPKTVRWGDATSDEMPLCQFRFTTRTLRDFVTMKKHYWRSLVQEFAGGRHVIR